MQERRAWHVESSNADDATAPANTDIWYLIIVIGGVIQTPS
jgi:hypothetical protein